MEIEILLSCMNQKDLSIVEKNNIKTKATIINQCDKDDYSEVVVNNNTIKVFSSTQRGLTNSRNLALMHANGDVCLLSDDDVVYKDDYKELIAEAFSKLSDADIIIFDINRLNYERQIKPLTEIRVAPKFKSYGSVRIAFKRESIQKNNIWFNKNFGSGSIFTSGEETLFLNESRRKKLKIYEYPAIIADVDFHQSTWRTGYNEKFFYDKGALLAEAYNNIKYILIFYYLFIVGKESSLSKFTIISWLLRGIKGYKELTTYDQYRMEKVKLTANSI